MKKITITALLCACIVLLASCMGNEAIVVHTMYAGQGTSAVETIIVTGPAETVIVTVPVYITSATEETTAPTEVITTAEPVVTTEPVTMSYDMKTETKTLGKGSIATLTYPQLKNSANEIAQKNANDLLSEIAFELFSKNDVSKEYAEKISAGAKVTLAISDCQVTYCTSALMSVRFYAIFSSSDRDDSYSFVYTCLINPSTGTEIQQKNVFFDQSGAQGTLQFKQNLTAVLNLLKDGNMKQEYVTAGFDGQVAISDWVESYIKTASYKITPQIYFTDKNLCIIVESTTTQGGWAEYSVSLDSVRQNLKVSPSN